MRTVFGVVLYFTVALILIYTSCTLFGNGVFIVDSLFWSVPAGLMISLVASIICKEGVG